MRTTRWTTYRPTRQEGTIRNTPHGALVVGLLLSASLVSGCKSKPKANGKTDSAANAAPKKPPERAALASGAGESTFRAPNDAKPPKLEPKWRVSWRAAEIQLVGKIEQVKMKRVIGEGFEKGTVASKFAAADGFADQTVKVLYLSGGVTVTSVDGGRKLTADKVEWLADKEMYKASGNVKVNMEEGVIGPIDQLMVNADLSVVSTREEAFK